MKSNSDNSVTLEGLFVSTDFDTKLIGRFTSKINGVIEERANFVIKKRRYG